MAVSAIAISVVVRNATIEAHLPGGMLAFVHSCPNQTFCTDGTISRVGFMVQNDAQTFANRLGAAGLAPSLTEAASEIALVIQGQGFFYPCDWLQLGLFEGYPSVWLAGTDRGTLFIPELDLNSGMAPPIRQSELRESFDFIGLKANGKVEVYRHKTTGALRYVGRPFHPVRKWWQFWKRVQQPPVDEDNHNQVYKAACDLILPYIEHQLEHSPLGSSARKHLRRGCELLSRVLQLDPGNGAALWCRGIAHKCLRELEPAYDDFQRAYALEALEKVNPNVGRELVGICIALGRGEEAVRVSREVLDRNSTDAGMISNYALALLIAGNVSEAQAVVENSLRLDPSDELTQGLAKFIASVRTGRAARPDRWPPSSSDR
jgi:tetratricopeptide (TPR) repeat protein